MKLAEDLTSVLDEYIIQDPFYRETTCDKCHKIQTCSPLALEDSPTKVYLCTSCHASVLKKVLDIGEHFSGVKNDLSFFKSTLTSLLEQII